MTATLSALTIGSRTLSPSFNANTHVYTCSTTSVSDTISATAAAGVTKQLFVNGVEMPFGSATWQAGQNTVVVITSYDGIARELYTVTVTKS